MAREPGRFRDETHCRTVMRRERNDAFQAEAVRRGLALPRPRRPCVAPALSPPVPCHTVVAPAARPDFTARWQKGCTLARAVEKLEGRPSTTRSIQPSFVPPARPVSSPEVTQALKRTRWDPMGDETLTSAEAEELASYVPTTAAPEVVFVGPEGELVLPEPGSEKDPLAEDKEEVDSQSDDSDLLIIDEEVVVDPVEPAQVAEE
ncbi:uncharacterized protein LOC130672936 [Microplitis mediator]|uniref:uncharacterized protein LOC130672936 n=1 Tax=Microplitis mediator TaxID=375433 RepID=UPI002553F8F3|nr:uncharacterized protein LOC130672936 [Microplitis mediator]